MYQVFRPFIWLRFHRLTEGIFLGLTQSKPIRLTPLLRAIPLVFVFRGLRGDLKVVLKTTPTASPSASQTGTLWRSLGLTDGGNYGQTQEAHLWATLWHSGSPMVGNDPRFSLGSEPKALKLLHRGSLCHSLIGAIIAKPKTLTYGALWGTLG